MSLKPSFVFAFLVHVTRYVLEMAISVVFLSAVLLSRTSSL